MATDKFLALNGSGRRIEKAVDFLYRVLVGGTLISDTRTGINLISGDGITVSGSDNSGSNRADVTVKFSTTIPSARVYRSSNQSISDATATILLFDSERYDTASLHSTVSNTGRLTAPIAGKYLITCGLEFASNVNGRREIRLLVNGSTIIAQDIRGGSISGITSPMMLTTVYSLAANDYVEVEVYQNRGGSLNVLASGNYSPEFAMHWIMP